MMIMLIMYDMYLMLEYMDCMIVLGYGNILMDVCLVDVLINVFII